MRCNQDYWRPRFKRGDKLFAHKEKLWATFQEYRCVGYGPDDKFAYVQLDKPSAWHSGETWYVYDLLAMG